MRWINFLSAIALGGCLTAVIAIYILNLFEVSEVLYTAIVLIAVTSGMTRATTRIYSLYLVSIPGNMAYLANDVLFGRKTAEGIRAYRIFFGGVKCKYPWEKIELEIDISHDKAIRDRFELEFKDSIGIVCFVLTRQPDPRNLLHFVLTSVEERKRESVIEATIKGRVKVVLGDHLADTNIRDAMSKTGDITKEILATNPFSGIEENYGILVTDFMIDDIDYTPEVKNAHEQAAVTDRLLESASKYLTNLGDKEASGTFKRRYTDEDIQEGRIKEEDLKWAIDSAKETAQEITREVVDLRGDKGGNRLQLHKNMKGRR